METHSRARWCVLILAVFVASCASARATVMPQCCTQKDILFAYNFDDGAPLEAYFDPTSLIDVSIGVGTGINGTNSLHSDPTGSAGFYAEASVLFPSTQDICGNERRGFAVGAYLTFENNDDPSGGFHFFEVRNSSAGGAEYYLSVYRIDRDIVVYDATGSNEVYRVVHAIPAVVGAGIFTKVEVVGSISSSTATEGFTQDGTIEVRINGRVYADGDDVDLIDPGDPPDPCVQGKTGLDFSNNSPAAGLGWDKITVNPMGDLDCLYIGESSSYCNDEPVLNRPGAKCPDPNPGGDPKGPRTVREGFVAAYVAPTGGGTPATASDPTDPQSLTNAATVLYSLDVTLNDATVLSFGQAPIVVSGRRYVDPRVVQFGRVEYPLSDRSGNVRGQVWYVDLADTDGSIRGYLDSSTNRFFTKWEGKLYAETDVGRLAATARQPQARGKCVSVTVPDDLVVRLTFADELTRQDSGAAFDQELPAQTIGDIFHGPSTTATGLQFLAMSAPRDKKESVSQPPDNLLEQAMPCLMGECSDDWRSAENPPVTPIGICKAYLLGDVYLKGSELWQCYLASQFAVTIPDNNVFGSNMNTDCPGSARLDMDALTDQFLIPGHGNWSSYFATNYIDFTFNGAVYRCTVFFARGPISLQHVDGIVPISFNAWGIEDVGDSTGNMFDDLSYMTQWFVDHLMIQHTLTGTWGAVATFADGVAKLRTSSFTAVKAIHNARLSTGYKGRLIIDRKRPAREWLAELLVSGHMRFGINHHGQGFITTLDDTQSLAGLTAYTDQQHIQDGSFKVTSERSGELENRVNYDWGPEPASGRTTGPLVPLDDTVSQTNWGVSPAPDFHFQAVGRQNVADDVSARRMIQTKDGITSGEFTIDLAGTALTTGQLIRVTDFRGLGSTGWTNRVLLVNGRVLNPNVSNPPQADDLTLAIQWEDQQRSLAAPAGAVGGGVTADGSTVRAIGFHPVGTTAGGNGWVVGDTATGNGWRVG